MSPDARQGGRRPLKAARPDSLDGVLARLRRRVEPTFVVHLEDTFLTNVPMGKRTPPTGEPWTYYLFARIERRWPTAAGIERHDERREVLVVEGATKEEVDAALLALVDRPEVVLDV